MKITAIKTSVCNAEMRICMCQLVAQRNNSQVLDPQSERSGEQRLRHPVDFDAR